MKKIYKLLSRNVRKCLLNICLMHTSVWEKTLNCVWLPHSVIKNWTVFGCKQSTAYKYIHDFFPYSKVRGTNMGPTRGRQDPGGAHVGPMNFAVWVVSKLQIGHII